MEIINTNSHYMKKKNKNVPKRKLKTITKVTYVNKKKKNKFSKFKDLGISDYVDLNKNMYDYGRVPRTVNNTKNFNNSSKELIKNYNMMKDSYARALLLPEAAENAKIPGLYPIPTVSFKKKITIPFSVNASGKAAILWNPFFAADASSGQTYILINNANTLNLITAEVLTGYTPQAFTLGISTGVFSAYRLVSASINIIPQMALNAASGTIAGGIMTQSGAAGPFSVGTDAFPFAGITTVSANVDNAIYYRKANITALEGIRCIYFPLDPSYESFIPINRPRSDDANVTGGGDDFYFVYYITGAPTLSNFNLELCVNIEFEPRIDSFTSDIATSYLGKEEVQKVTRSLCSKEQLINQASVDLSNVVDNEESNFKQLNNGSFMDDTFDFLLQHAPAIGSIARQSLSAFF